MMIKDKALFGYNKESQPVGARLIAQIKEPTPFEYLRVAPLQAFEVMFYYIIN